MDLELSSQVQTSLIMRRMSQQLPRLVGEQEVEEEVEVEVEEEEDLEEEVEVESACIRVS